VAPCLLAVGLVVACSWNAGLILAQRYALMP
jgi:hypothetical protein